MDLTAYTNEGFIREIFAREKHAAIDELARVFEGAGVCEEMDTLIEALIEREKLMTTGIGFKIAVPHTRIKQVRKIAFAVGISKKGIDFDAIDKKPAHLLIMVVAGAMQHNEYLRLLSRIMNTLKHEDTITQLLHAATASEIISILKKGSSFCSG